MRLNPYIITLVAVILGPQASLAQAAEPSRPAPPPITGKLSQVNGLPVLELWGTPEQRGFAHGYLRAAEIVQLFDEFVFSPEIVPSLEAYNEKLRPAAEQQFEWPAAIEAELAGLVAGTNRRLSELKRQSTQLKRPFDVTDFKVANALADWRGSACSTVTLWGPMTKNGRTLTARNLDYISTPVMRVSQQVIIQRDQPGRHSWLGVCWPGAVGIYTALSDVGVTMLLHDSNGLPRREDCRFIPRSIALRMALEKADVDSAFEDVAEVFRHAPTLIGNNVHVSRPYVAGRPCAAVFEYDGNAKDKGVTLRLAEDPSPGALLCTNHMRLRQTPQACNRYAALSKAIDAHRAQHDQLDARQMFELIKTARVDRTLHTVCIEPQARLIWVYIPEIAPQPIRLSLANYHLDPASNAAAE